MARGLSWRALARPMTSWLRLVAHPGMVSASARGGKAKPGESSARQNTRMGEVFQHRDHPPNMNQVICGVGSLSFPQVVHCQQLAYTNISSRQRKWFLKNGHHAGPSG